MDSGKTIILAIAIIVVTSLLLQMKSDHNRYESLQDVYNDSISDILDENSLIDSTNAILKQRYQLIKDSLKRNAVVVDSLKNELSNVSNKYEDTYRDINDGVDSTIINILSR